MTDDYPLEGLPGGASETAGVIGPGVLLGTRYRVGEAIGRGGMAMVYRGYDELLDRDVAIKVLGLQAANATGSRQEFLREARAAAALSHPNIVGVFDAGVHGGERYIVMQFVPGGGLSDLIQESAPLAPGRAVQLATQVADALDYGHRHGVIHCDVKPQNVLLDESGRPKLVDFGISRTIAATGALTDTITGTAGYIAPEQLLGEKLDGRADVYALGCVLYEMLSGELPFEGSNLAALATQRLVRPPVPLRKRNPRVPPALAECVMRAIEREPSRRFATAGEFSQALEASHSGVGPFPLPLDRTAPLGRRSTAAPTAAHSELAEGRPARKGGRARGEGAHLFWPVALVVLGVLILGGALAALELPSILRPVSPSIGRIPSATAISTPQPTALAGALTVTPTPSPKATIPPQTPSTTPATPTPSPTPTATAAVSQPPVVIATETPRAPIIIPPTQPPR